MPVTAAAPMGPVAQPSAYQGSLPPGGNPGGGPPGPASVGILPPLDQLLAPIALYPDPLIGLILPSATVPAQIASAAMYVNGQGDPNLIANQPWTDAVKGLAHYPEVVKWMNQNSAWTEQLGAAFASEPAAVMSAIQDLRSRAQTAGTLQSGPQEQVVTDNGAIEIEPAQPDVIYVPSYDPNMVYFAPPPGYYADSYFYWGNPYPMGGWMTYDFDWRGGGLWRGNWYDYRREHGGWGHPVAFGGVRFSDAHGPERWNGPANAPHWSAPQGRSFGPMAPIRREPEGFRNYRQGSGGERGGGEHMGGGRPQGGEERRR
jgi:hypothetical protein